MSVPNPEFSEHNAKHDGFFHPDCEFCDEMQQNGIWWGQNYVSHDKLKEIKEFYDDSTQSGN